MDLTLSATEAAFRDELRRWLAAQHRSDEPGDEEARFAWLRHWQRTLHDGGWGAVHWPSEYGGRDASLTQSAIFYEELGRARRPLRANVIGVLLAGPTILAWGVAEQKARYLAPILSAEEIWCQGFSEPEAGSDLASLRTHAVRDGDDWVVTGQKLWTSNAQYAKWCMLLARTDLGAPRHKGLTFFLLDMDQPGVDIRPLRQITGESEFNEVFFNQARVPDANILGTVGSGWQVALTTLMNERAGLGFFLQVRLRVLLDELITEADQRGLLDDPAVADQLGDLLSRSEALRLNAYRGLATIDRDGQPGPEGSLVKLMWSECNQLLTQAAIDVLGPDTLAARSPWSRELLRARANTIEGGTSEVLKNIVAERVLGLPKAV